MNEIDNDLSCNSKRLFSNNMFRAALAILFLDKLFLKSNFYVPFKNEFLTKRKFTEVEECFRKYTHSFNTISDKILKTSILLEDDQH